MYGHERTIDDLLELAEATRDSGFQHDYGNALRQSMEVLADAEAGASAVSDYNSELVTGLLQTPAYARAVTEVQEPPEAVVERRVAFRLRRQRVFFDRPSPARLEAVITPGALGVQVGSPAVMDEQRRHLVELARRDHVHVSVLPGERGLHTAMTGPFTLLDFADAAFASVAYVENLIGSRYFERPEHVAGFHSAFSAIRARSVPIEEYLR